MVDIARATRPRCGATISADDPAGLYPRCLASGEQDGQRDVFRHPLSRRLQTPTFLVGNGVFRHPLPWSGTVGVWVFRPE